MTHDVAVIGLGGIGSAVAAHCATRGARTIGLEQFAPAHELCSSTGRSRLIRQAYFEDPAYVPLLLRAYELWRELERATGEPLLATTGLLMVGKPEAPIVAGAQHAARAHDLPIELLDPRAIVARYPTLRVLPHELGVFEPAGGVLAPERATRAHRTVATQAGAELRFDAAVERWEPAGAGFVVVLADGSRVEAHALILAGGPWLQDALGVPLRVQRNVQAWFAPAMTTYTCDRFPPFLLERDDLPAPLYGFPDFGDGVKAAFHAHGALTDMEHLGREIELEGDIAPIAAALAEWMPGAAGTFLGAKTCPYTLTPDGHFVVDRNPSHPRVVLCGGFSGHGFKFAPVIGEIAADLALEGGTSHEIGFLSPRRFPTAGSDL